MIRTPALLLTAVLAFGTACSAAEDAENDASDAASEASDAASELVDDATDSADGENASDAATSLAAEASDAATSLAAEASKAAEDVDWEQYPPQLRDRIDTWVEEDNCAGLDGVVDRFDVLGATELVDYVKERIDEAGCA